MPANLQAAERTTLEDAQRRVLDAVRDRIDRGEVRRLMVVWFDHEHAIDFAWSGAGPGLTETLGTLELLRDRLLRDAYEARP